MTSKRIVFKRDDDTIGVITPILDAMGPEETEEQFVLRVANKDVPYKYIKIPTGLLTAGPGGTVVPQYDTVAEQYEWKIVDQDDLPLDRFFRDAWVIDGDVVEVDMEAARREYMNLIRKFRAEKFKELGFPERLNPQLEEAVVSQEMREILQNLRDIPQIFDLSGAETPEELKSLWPLELGQNPYDDTLPLPESHPDIQ